MQKEISSFKTIDYPIYFPFFPNKEYIQIKSYDSLKIKQNSYIDFIIDYQNTGQPLYYGIYSESLLGNFTVKIFKNNYSIMKTRLSALPNPTKQDKIIRKYDDIYEMRNKWLKIPDIEDSTLRFNIIYKDSIVISSFSLYIITGQHPFLPILSQDKIKNEFLRIINPLEAKALLFNCFLGKMLTKLENKSGKTINKEEVAKNLVVFFNKLQNNFFSTIFSIVAEYIKFQLQDLHKKIPIIGSIFLLIDSFKDKKDTKADIQIISMIHGGMDDYVITKIAKSLTKDILYGTNNKINNFKIILFKDLSNYLLKDSNLLYEITEEALEETIIEYLFSLKGGIEQIKEMGNLQK